MIDKNRKELDEALEAFQNIERIKRHLHDLGGRLQISYKEQDKLSKALDKEKADFEDLEKLSVKGLFYKVLGSKEEQKEKERQEYLEAALRYNDAKKSIELLEFEKNTLEEKLRKAPRLKTKLEKLMKAREKAIVKSNSTEGRKLLNLVHGIDRKVAMKREIHEALEVGTKAIELLVQMDKQMAKVSNWGTWGKQRRGPMRAYYNKSSMDKAQELAIHAQHFLQKLEVELKDVYGRKYTNLSKKLNNFKQFSSIFIESLLLDWMVQQKIRNARTNVHYVHDRVTRIVNTLNTDLTHMESVIEQSEEKRRQMIIQS